MAKETPDAVDDKGRDVTIGSTDEAPVDPPTDEEVEAAGPIAPLVAGEVAADPEVDHSADADGDEKSVDPDAPVDHVKVFVLGGKHNELSLENYDHAGNIAATRQYMISQGLRPVGDVTFVGAETNPDGISLDLTYTVKAIPAEAATDLEVAHAPVVQPGTEETAEGDDAPVG